MTTNRLLYDIRVMKNHPLQVLVGMEEMRSFASAPGDGKNALNELLGIAIAQGPNISSLEKKVAINPNLKRKVPKSASVRSQSDEESFASTRRDGEDALNKLLSTVKNEESDMSKRSKTRRKREKSSFLPLSDDDGSFASLGGKGSKALNELLSKATKK
eukprot:CAMPEP_0195279614 /NCGR_PEP_ID=MMETSP0706-20130129/20571_1 /TAXON_ID=33640 /ORGANISM="Asterionellopsis glacialis, Strain CCMP134" /LENGTH=158 /DNA_ID=CAMNT_0040338151 /DNA_START=107 /DNA_END=583 /DNA_ORIENTATION=-